MIYNNKNGFTLTELLVVIVILGIVSTLSIPIIRNAQMRNENRKYTNYLESLKYSAKLYVDSYSDDLFGNEKSGCAVISFGDLKTKTLLKDIDIDNISCNSDDTFVKVVKINDRYGYSANIGCGKESGGTVHVTKRFPEVAVSKTNCSIDSDVLMTINASPTQSSSNDVKRKKIKVTVNSTTGINQQPLIFYGFNTTGNNTIDGEWQPLPITLPTESDQISTVESGNTVSVTSDEILTPEGVTGDYYLMIRVDRLQDLVGRDWKRDLSNPYIKTGPYRVDNTKPVITKLEAKSTTTEYNNLKVKLTYAVNDTYYTPSNEIKVCFSESKTECSSFGSNSSPTNYTVSGDYDGKTRTIYIHAKDKAGNIGVSSVDYTVYEKCSETKSDEKWSDTTECSKKCGSGIKSQKSKSVDIYLGVACTKEYTQEVECNTQTCCSKTEKKAGDWGSWTACTKQCGTGTQKHSRTITYVSEYDGSTCKTETETVSQNCNTRTCCSETTTEYGQWSSWTTCSKNCGGGKQSRSRTVKTISSFDNSIVCKTKTEKEEQNCNTQACCTNPKSSTGAWSSWSSCDKKCGGGTQTRKRTITYTSSVDGSSCGSTVETDSRTCNEQSCCSSTVVDHYGNWGNWRSCSVSCGDGVQKRSRTIYYKSSYDGSSCGTGTGYDSQSCNKGACPDPPTCSISVSNGVTPTNGWYKKTVELKLNVRGTPTAQGLVESKTPTYNGYTNATVSSEGKHTYFGFVKNAGGSNYCWAVVNIDKTPPTIGNITKHTGDPWPDNGKDEKYYVNIDIADSLSGLGNRVVTSTDKGGTTTFNYNFSCKSNFFQEGLATGFTSLTYNFTTLCDCAGNCIPRSKSGTVNFP